MIDEEVDVGKTLRDAADVDARRVFVGLRSEWQALVHGNVLDAELARLLDEGEADVVVEEEALAVRPPLRVGLPRGDLVTLGEHVHALEIAGLIGIDTPVNEQAVR